MTQLSQAIKELPGGEDARLDTTLTMMCWAADLLFEFARERDVINTDFQRSASSKARKIFTDILSQQSKTVQKIKSTAPRGNLAWYILRGYRKNHFQIVKRKHVKSTSNSFVEGETLCIALSTLLSYLKEQLPTQKLTDKALGKYLRQNGIIPEYAEAHSGGMRVGKKRWRYLEINLLALSQKSKKI